MEDAQKKRPRYGVFFFGFVDTYALNSVVISGNLEVFLRDLPSKMLIHF
jgi:hypothetical protein